MITNILFPTIIAFASTRSPVQSLIFGIGVTIDTYFKKNYISNGLLTYKATTDIQKILTGKEDGLIQNLIAAGASLLCTHFFNFDLVSDLRQTADNTYESLSSMSHALPEEKYQIIGAIALSVFGQIGVTELFRYYVNGFYTDRANFLDKEEPNKEAYLECMRNGLPKMLLAKLIDSLWGIYISPMFSTGIAKKIKSKLIPTTFDNVAARAIINDPELKEDLRSAMEIEYNISGNINLIASNLKNIYFFCKDYKEIEDTISVNLPLIVCNGFFNGLYKSIDLNFSAFNDMKDEFIAAFYNSLDDTIENMRSIKAKKAEVDMERLMFELLQQKETYEKQSKFMEFSSKAFWNICNMSNPVMWSYVMYKIKILDGKEWKNLYPIFTKSESIYNFSEMLNNVAMPNEDLRTITRVIDLIQHLESLKEHNKDYEYTTSTTSRDIIINRLKIHYGESTILDMNKACVITPKIYAFIGPVGRGKSTIMEVLRLGKEAIPDVDGEVVVPDKFMMFSQSDFIARGKFSLLELMSFPVKLTQDNEWMIRNKVTTFLTSLKFDEEISSTIEGLIARFNEKRYDWREVLSGGEKKLTQLCNFFMEAEDANAIFLDESLNGLDPKLTLKVMQKIKQDWSDKIVIIITHNKEAQDSLYKQEYNLPFFDKIIEFQGEELYIH